MAFFDIAFTGSKSRNEHKDERIRLASMLDWNERLLPGAGGINFDPTNRSVGGINLILVAVARDIQQAMPVSNSFVGVTDAVLWTSAVVFVTS
jgi:hypothetical protein